MATTLSDDLLAGLPESLRAAQRAIHTPEIQEILRTLAKHNLGICLPHLHRPGGGFADLPDDVVQVERGLVVGFVERQALDDEVMLPVAWRWQERAGGDAAGVPVGEVQVIGACNKICSPVDPDPEPEPEPEPEPQPEPEPENEVSAV